MDEQEAAAYWSRKSPCVSCGHQFLFYNEDDIHTGTWGLSKCHHYYTDQGAAWLIESIKKQAAAERRALTRGAIQARQSFQRQVENAWQEQALNDVSPHSAGWYGGDCKL